MSALNLLLQDLGCDHSADIESDENLQKSDKFLRWLRDIKQDSSQTKRNSTPHNQIDDSVKNVVKLIEFTKDLIGSVNIDTRSISIRNATKEYMDKEALFTRNLVMKLEGKNEGHVSSLESRGHENAGLRSLYTALENIQIAADIEFAKQEALVKFREKLPLLLESIDINSHRENLVTHDVLDNDRRRLRAKIKAMKSELADIKIGLKSGAQDTNDKPDYELMQLKIILSSLAEQRDRYIRVSELINKEQAVVQIWKDKLDYALQTIDFVGPQFCREAYIYHKRINRN